jgi:hypothetical protein
MQFGQNDTIRHVLDQFQAYYNIPHPLYWEGNVPDNTRALTLFEDETTHAVIDGVTGVRYNIEFRGATGVWYNVALQGADQTNIAAGPGSATGKNRAEGKGTIQRNTSLCMIL